MKNKEKIIKIISKYNCGCSVKIILKELKNSLNKTTIYRNIKTLLLNGKIIEDFLITGEKVYSLKQKHHHHFICIKCGKKENIGCFLKKDITMLENKFQFKTKSHSLILNGVCNICN